MNHSDLDCRSLKLPPGGIVVLPIDDLDLQVARTRELLLALRVLRHERIVYILTGDIEGTDLALGTDFYREFSHDIPSINELVGDKIGSHVLSLGKKLREKTIPESQTFQIVGLGLDTMEGLDWGPHGREGTKLKELLDKWWGSTDTNPSTLSEFLHNRHVIQGIKRPFREVQSFFDRWEKHRSK